MNPSPARKLSPPGAPGGLVFSRLSRGRMCPTMNNLCRWAEKLVQRPTKPGMDGFRGSNSFAEAICNHLEVRESIWILSAKGASLDD